MSTQIIKNPPIVTGIEQPWLVKTFLDQVAGRQEEIIARRRLHGGCRVRRLLFLG